jgi:3-hydroxyisobutyrate dehydrogenase
VAGDKASTGRVGFVGLGNMGMPMAGHLVAAGYHVIGFDASAAVMRAIAEADEASVVGDTDEVAGGGSAGAAGKSGVGAGGRISAAPSLSAVGDDVCAVILSLPDSDVVEHVLRGDGGLLASLVPGSTVIDMSSSDPARTRKLAERTATAGVTLVDAPVSGGVAGARAASLAIMVGGTAEAFAAVQPLLAHLGARVVHAGDVGAGHAVKALNNLMSAAHMIASSEALIAGRRFGLDPAVMLEIVNGSSGRSWSTETKWPRYVLTERYDAGFNIRLMVKDIKLALAIEHATGTPSPVSEAVAAAWEAAAGDLPADADHTAIARWLDEI